MIVKVNMKQIYLDMVSTVSPLLGCVLLICLLWGCTSPQSYLQQADDVAYAIISGKQQQLDIDNGTEPFALVSAGQQLRQKLLLEQDLPTTAGLESADSLADTAPYQLSLLEALQVAAHNSREFQQQKELVFRTALELDLQRDMFGSTFSGFLSSMWSTTKVNGSRVGGLTNTGNAGWDYRFKSGAAFVSSIGLDLVQLLSGDRVSSRGLVADASVSIPLLRGAGSRIVTEPLQQAERNVVYALWGFERYRRAFAVKVASDYLLALEKMNQVETSFDNYQRLISAHKRAKRLADAGRLSQIQVGQAAQDELRARSRWVNAQQGSADRLDNFKIQLGLPVDAQIVLNRQVLDKNAAVDLSIDRELVVNPPAEMLAIAITKRRDLLIAQGRVLDSKRAIYVAEDNLRAELTLLGRGTAGSSRSLAGAGLDNARLDLDHGYYSALLSIDLPFERTAERNALRNAWLDYQQRKRDLAGMEDMVKYQVRSAWRGRQEAFEMIKIQTQALAVATRRVASSDIFLRAGRIQMRDLLEAQDDLVSARNALVEAQVQYRTRAMELARDLGTLNIDPDGKWLEAVIEDESMAK